MADLAHYDRLQRAFDDLLQDLSTAWPKQDLDYVREEVGHGEYSDALENLIAIGFRNGASFDSGQAGQVEALAVAMGIEQSPFLAQLREARKQARNNTKRFEWLESLKQIALTFVALFMIMAASAVLGIALGGSPSTHLIGVGLASSVVSQVLSSSMFFLLLAGFAWWRVRSDWWRARHEMADLFG